MGTLVSSTNKTDHHDIIEILLKVALCTTTITYAVASIIFVGVKFHRLSETEIFVDI